MFLETGDVDRYLSISVVAIKLSVYAAHLSWAGRSYWTWIRSFSVSTVSILTMFSKITSSVLVFSRDSSGSSSILNVGISSAVADEESNDK